MSPTKCNHERAFPLEYRLGKVATSRPGESFRQFIDWRHADGMSAHRIRCSKLYCPKCRSIIDLPLPTDEL